MLNPFLAPRPGWLSTDASASSWCGSLTSHGLKHGNPTPLPKPSRLDMGGQLLATGAVCRHSFPRICTGKAGVEEEKRGGGSR